MSTIFISNPSRECRANRAAQSAGENGCSSSRRLADCARADYGFRELALSHAAPSMNVTAGSLIGQPVGRAEDPRFLRGRGSFIADVSRQGMLHAVILRVAIAALASAISFHATAAQDAYPNRLIKLVVPFAAGGNTDGRSARRGLHAESAARERGGREPRRRRRHQRPPT